MRDAPGLNPDRSRAIVGAVVAVATIATCLVVALPPLRFAYVAPNVRIALETVAVLVSLLASCLVFGRFRRNRRLDNLLLATGLAVLAAANLLGVALLTGSLSDLGRLLVSGANAAGAILLAGAAFAQRRPLARRELPRVLAASMLVTAAVLGLLVALDALFEPAGAEIVRNPTHPRLESDVGLLIAQSLALAAFAAASAGFTLRAEREHDAFLGFVAVGTALGAFARIHYILFAPAQGGLVRTGDVFRALLYAVLFAGAAREIGEYSRRLAQTAVLEERRRIARDLHDGVAQELAFIGRRAKRLVATTGDDGAREILASAERALGDSRRAIAALTKPLDVPLADVLEEAVGEVAQRYDVAVDFDFDRAVEVDADTREALVRIACEAVSNAALHGQARVVRVELAQGEVVRFGVVDDGRGFDPRAPRPARFGIQIMRERAQAVGGSFRLRSAPDAGTRVEVILP